MALPDALGECLVCRDQWQVHHGWSSTEIVGGGHLLLSFLFWVWKNSKQQSTISHLRLC